MKNKYLLLLLIVFSHEAISQTADHELENKYFNYRDRLKKYFTQIGSEAGQSITTAQVKLETQASDSFRIINGVRTYVSPRSYNGAQHFGDAVVDQGFYLAVLASEYRNMVLQGRQNSPEFKALSNELYFAINAVDRLDEKAEQYLDYSALPAKNGFFIRSDHDEKYISRIRNNPAQPIEKIQSGGANGPAISFIDTTSGIRVYGLDSFQLILNKGGSENAVSWIGGPGNYGTTYNWGNEMSQDQVYGLLMGFMCVKRWVDGSLIVDPDGNAPALQSKNIVNWVAEITGRIVSHVSKQYNHPVSTSDISNELEKIQDTVVRRFIFKLPDKNQYYINYHEYWKEISENHILEMTVYC